MHLRRLLWLIAIGELSRERVDFTHERRVSSQIFNVNIVFFKIRHKKVTVSSVNLLKIHHIEALITLIAVDGDVELVNLFEQNLLV